MAEVTLNSQLSGTEVVEAIVDKVRAKLRRDCYLSPNMAYDWFMATIKIELDVHDAGTTLKIDTTEVIAEGEEPGEDEPIMTVSEHMDIPAAPPNTVRIETGQDIPTLTKENGKNVVKGVRYGKPKPQRG